METIAIQLSNWASFHIPNDEVGACFGNDLEPSQLVNQLILHFLDPLGL